MKPVTPDEARETYDRTVRDYPRESWANWIIAVSNSVACRQWIGGDAYQAYAKEVFNQLMGEGVKISFADSK